MLSPRTAPRYRATAALAASLAASATHNLRIIFIFRGKEMHHLDVEIGDTHNKNAVFTRFREKTSAMGAWADLERYFPSLRGWDGVSKGHA